MQITHFVNLFVNNNSIVETIWEGSHMAKAH
jgi:hypothetical protein